MEIPKVIILVVDDELVEFIAFKCVLEGHFLEDESKEDDSQGEDIAGWSMVWFGVSLHEMYLRSHVSLPCAFELAE
jgi:hypothetical protein